MRRSRSLTLVALAAVTLLVVGASWPAASSSGARAPRAGVAGPRYGHIVRVAPSTLMILGRALDVARGQADIGNAILYRRGETLYIIDTGATTSFRPFLRRAIHRLQPFRNVVLINSHGHPDHTGNNSIVTKVAGACHWRYYMSRRDYSIVDNLNGWLLRAFREISGYVPGFDHPVSQTRQLLKLFEPQHSLRGGRRAIETLPQRTIRIGRLRMRGWVLGGGGVDVLPTRGHTPGSLSFYFPRIGLLHMADELNSYYPAFPEANPRRIRTVFGLALKAAAGNDVRLLTDGHTFSVIRGARHVRTRLRSYIAGYDAMDRLFRRWLASPGGVTVSELIDRMAKAPQLQDKPGGSDFGAFTGAMVALKKLKQLGATSTSGPRADRRFRLP